jgi:hypothetical protein
MFLKSSAGLPALFRVKHSNATGILTKELCFNLNVWELLGHTVFKEK